MRLFLGMILGAVLTVGAAYIHDSLVTGTPAAQRGIDDRPIVNWDVATRDWNDFTARVRRAWTKLTAK